MASPMPLAAGPGPLAALGRPAQLALLALALLVPGVLIVAYHWNDEGPYVPLFAALPAEDAGAIVQQLKAGKTPYRLGGAGDQVLVPADRASELRLRLAMQGLPLGGGVGFEVFDKPAFGVSDFAQRLNYQRALQGELARTIGQLREVARARVHLVLPQSQIFVERERPASASVFLKLHPGAVLGRDQIRGIVHLVASSVEGLSSDRVTVVDTSGRVLAVGGDGHGPGAALSPRQLEAKTAIEETLERRVQSLLDATLGPGRSVARVSAQLSLEQVERTEERFDPNAVARQKSRSTDSTKGRSTTPSAPAGPSEAEREPREAVTQNDGSRESESVTYEISRVLAKTLIAPGELRRVSVAVMLDTGTRASGGGDGAAAPRTPEQIETIRKVVMSAVGFNEARGDQVTVVELPFDTTVADRERALLEQPAPGAARPARPEPLAGWSTPSLALGGTLAAAVVLLVAGAAWLIGRRRTHRSALETLARTLEAEPAPGRADGGARSAVPHVPRPPQPLVAEELLELTRERDDIRQKALALASSEPDATAQLLRAWLVKKKQLQAAGRGGQDAG
jgi:flagellar M-ring protein FliF